MKRTSSMSEHSPHEGLSGPGAPVADLTPPQAGAR
jgi:hypothetical protein